MMKHLIAATIFLLGEIPAMANTEFTPSNLFPNIRIQGQRFILSDEAAHSLTDVLIFYIPRPSPIISPRKTDEAAQALGLPIVVDPLRQEVIDVANKHIEAFELFQTVSRGQFSLLSPVLAGVSEHGVVELKVPKTPANPEVNSGPEYSYHIGAFWLVFKPGYHPEVIFEDWNKAKSGEWIEHRVTLKAWPERAAKLKDRPYVMENLQLQKAINKHWNGRDPGGKPLFGKDPFVVWEERLKAFQEEALKRGNKLDAAWLELALAQTSKRRPGGLDNSGGKDDYVNGRVWKALDRMIELAPEMRVWQAFRDERTFVLSSPMGLNQDGFPSERNKGFNQQIKWTAKGMDMFLDLLRKYEDEPLIALILGNRANCNGFWWSDQKLRDRFFRHRVNLMAKWLKKYPSVLWFSGFDALCSGLTASDGFYYPLAYKDELLKNLK